MNIFFKIILYTRTLCISTGALAFLGMFYISNRIIIPIVYAVLIAMGLNFIVKYFLKKKLDKERALYKNKKIVKEPMFNPNNLNEPS